MLEVNLLVLEVDVDFHFINAISSVLISIHQACKEILAAVHHVTDIGAEADNSIDFDVQTSDIVNDTH